jgi:hypothetical protein
MFGKQCSRYFGSSTGGAGLESIAPNLLLFLVLQECPPDIPTLFPTLDSQTAPFDRTLAPDLQRTDGDISSPSISAVPPYSIEIDTPKSGTHSTLTMKGFTNDEKEH